MTGPVRPRRPLGAAPAPFSAGVQKKRGPWNWRGESGHFAKHNFHDVPYGIRRILGPSAATQPAIHEELKQIERERPQKQDRTQGILPVPKHVS